MPAARYRLPARRSGCGRRRRGATRPNSLASESGRWSASARVEERPREERDHQPSDESADVGPVRDAGGLIAHGDRTQTVDELQQRPDPDHEDRWHRPEKEEVPEREEHAHLVLREE